MSKIERRELKSAGSPTWNHIHQAVSRLAAASAASLPRVEEPHPTRCKAPAPMLPSAPDLALPPMARDQLALDIAEIERATAALRRAEPSLEPWLPDAQAPTEPRRVRSVWVFVAVTWLSVGSVFSCAIGAILLLFG